MKETQQRIHAPSNNGSLSKLGKKSFIADVVQPKQKSDKRWKCFVTYGTISVECRISDDLIYLLRWVNIWGKKTLLFVSSKRKRMAKICLSKSQSKGMNYLPQTVLTRFLASLVGVHDSTTPRVFANCCGGLWPIISCISRPIPTVYQVYQLGHILR